MNRWSLWVLVCTVGSSWAVAQDPEYYVRRDTWPETLLASREAFGAYAATLSSGPEGVTLS